MTNGFITVSGFSCGGCYVLLRSGSTFYHGSGCQWQEGSYPMGYVLNCVGDQWEIVFDIYSGYGHGFGTAPLADIDTSTGKPVGTMTMTATAPPECAGKVYTCVFS
jgi:hypothetical protein